MDYNDSLYSDDSRDKNLFNILDTDLGNEFKGKCEDYGI